MLHLNTILHFSSFFLLSGLLIACEIIPIKEGKLEEQEMEQQDELISTLGMEPVEERTSEKELDNRKRKLRNPIKTIESESVEKSEKRRLKRTTSLRKILPENLQKPAAHTNRMDQPIVLSTGTLKNLHQLKRDKQFLEKKKETSEELTILISSTKNQPHNLSWIGHDGTTYLSLSQHLKDQLEKKEIKKGEKELMDTLTQLIKPSQKLTVVSFIEKIKNNANKITQLQERFKKLLKNVSKIIKNRNDVPSEIKNEIRADLDLLAKSIYSDNANNNMTLINEAANLPIINLENLVLAQQYYKAGVALCQNFKEQLEESLKQEAKILLATIKKQVNPEEWEVINKNIERAKKTSQKNIKGLIEVLSQQLTLIEKLENQPPKEELNKFNTEETIKLIATLQELVDTIYDEGNKITLNDRNLALLKAHLMDSQALLINLEQQAALRKDPLEERSKDVQSSCEVAHHTAQASALEKYFTQQAAIKHYIIQ